jgi:hypothetical protein
MAKVDIMELGGEHMQFIKEMTLSRVPVTGDKIFIEYIKDGNANTCVYDVVDVHFADDGATDVCVINVGRQRDYLDNLEAMHELK